MKIGIIGKGVVGEAFGKYLSLSHNVVYYDKFKDENDFNVLKDTDYTFICTPTPMNQNRSSNIESVIESVEKMQQFPESKIIIKSTVPVGTTDRLSEEYNRNIIFSPEFLTARNAFNDVMNSYYMIYGKRDNHIDAQLMDIFPRKKTILMSNKNAEFLKYARNTILASQIATANEINNIAEHMNINYKSLIDLILLDNRIGTNIHVPGPDGKKGFGGACFPKDLNSLIYQAEENGFDPKLLNQIWECYGRNE